MVDAEDFMLNTYGVGMNDDYDTINDLIIEENWAEYVRHCKHTGETPTDKGCLEWAEG